MIDVSSLLRFKKPKPWLDVVLVRAGETGDLVSGEELRRLEKIEGFEVVEVRVGGGVGSTGSSFLPKRPMFAS